MADQPLIDRSTVILPTDSGVQYRLADSSSVYLQRLFAVPDTDITPDLQPHPDDTKAQAESKQLEVMRRMKLKAERINELLKTLKSPGFKIIEQAMVDVTKQLERIDIWDALDKGDRAAIDTVRSHHSGLMMFFQTYGSASETARDLEEELNRLLTLKKENLAATDQAAALMTPNP